MYGSIFYLIFLLCNIVLNAKKVADKKYSKSLDPIISVGFKSVNKESFVLSAIIAHWREYPGTRLLKLLPTWSK